MKYINAINSVLCISFLTIGYMAGTLHSDIRFYNEAKTSSAQKLAASHGWKVTQSQFLDGTAHVDQRLAVAKLADGSEAALIIRAIDPTCVIVAVERNIVRDVGHVIRYGETYQFPDPDNTKDHNWLNVTVKRGEVYPQISLERVGVTKL